MIRTKEEAKQFIEKITAEFKERHIKSQITEELIFIDNVEKEHVKGYHGREILELLQNADDAYQKALNEGKKLDELNVCISLCGNTLSISNTGTFFDEEGIKAIVQSHNSPKAGKYIGNKGTGFRSILNWSERVRIFSGNFNLEFSKEIATEVFNSIKSEEQLQKQLAKYPQLYVPMLAVPKYINQSHEYSIETTTIEITVDPEKNNDDYSVQTQLNNIDFRILLFLPNVAQITINIDGAETVYTRSKIIQKDSLNSGERVVDRKSSIILKKKANGLPEAEERYALFERTVKETLEEDNTLKDVQMTLAVPLDRETFCCEHLYTFFPIFNTQSPFNCVMHATYALSGNRDSLTFSENNKKIILLQLQHLISVAQNYVDEKDYNSALYLLTPKNIKMDSTRWSWKFAQGFSNFKVEEEYLSLFKDFSFLPTVNDKCVSIQNNPKMIDQFPISFKGDSFNLLLNKFEDMKIQQFVKVLAGYYNIDLAINEEDLCACINAISDNWNAGERADVFDWWAERYTNILPNLLKKQDGTWLKYKERCYFLDGNFQEDSLPNWVKTPSLNLEDQDCLFQKAKKNKRIIKISESNKIENGRVLPISRLISQNGIYAELVDFEYRDRSNIIYAVNASVDTYDKSVDFIKWLWGNYGKEEGWTPPRRNENPPYKYNFPGYNQQQVKSSDELYFGKEYYNHLAEKLFTNEYDEMPPLKEFNLENVPLDAFEDFIAKFGVRRFPKIKEKKIENLMGVYAARVKDALEKQYDSRGLLSYSVPLIDNLEEILTKQLSFEEIIRWINEDGELYTYLRALKQNAGKTSISCMYKKGYQRKDLNAFVSLENYILYIFNEIKWVEIRGEKYSPREIAFDKVGSGNKKFEKLIPYLDLRVVAKSISMDAEKLTEVLNLFDFCPSILRMDSNRFYGLLLDIPNVRPLNESIDMYRAVYRLVEQLDHTPNYEDSLNKKKFFAEGKVLVKRNKTIEYRSVQEAFLPSSKIICKKDVAIIEKNWRKGNSQAFKSIFNCKEYTEETKIVYETLTESLANEAFQKYFKDFKKYAKAYKQINANIQRDFDKISITLVSFVEVEVAGRREKIDEEYVLLGKSSTQVYITVLGDTFDVRRLSEHIEDIFINIVNITGFDANKIGELFRTREKEDREFLIIKEFNSLSVLNGDTFSEVIKSNFLATVANINPNYDLEKINIDFSDFESKESIEKVIGVFKDLKITEIVDFIKKGFEYHLSFDDYYRDQLDCIIRDAEIQYKNYLYGQALNDVSLQSSFLKKFRVFVNYQFNQKIAGIIDVKQHLVEKFGDWRKESLEDKAGAIYTENYKKMNPGNRFNDLIRNDENAQTMIYFGKEKDFKVWLQEQQSVFDADQNAGKQNPYDQLLNVIPSKTDIVYSYEEDSKTVSSSARRGYGRSYTSSMEEKNNKKKKIAGNKGELLIYNYLKDQYADKVTAISEAFEDMGILTPGQGDSTKGYDIEYRDDNGALFFVEVKTGSPNGFIISPKEMEFAKQHAEEYELYLVYDLDANPPAFIKLPRKFWEDKKFRLKNIIEKIEVVF